MPSPALPTAPAPTRRTLLATGGAPGLTTLLTTCGGDKPTVSTSGDGSDTKKAP
ncbi:hypothetical protein GTY65_36725 [Streptomyces sp. SID8379]|uniref:hypothetical protein n=1 Tax=unclassified Streptomyces TaxID=2593676 RepID=UPI000379936F|nr:MULTISPECIES: hypothetical protein [unclassified Streptomyces]MYW69571.1 hypothetical protein [Streptomyces sp. SID8379]